MGRLANVALVKGCGGPKKYKIRTLRALVVIAIAALVAVVILACLSWERPGTPMDKGARTQVPADVGENDHASDANS